MVAVPISPDATRVLRFWFEETPSNKWFARDPAFDALVRARFHELTTIALARSLDSWDERPEEALALVLLLDQFPRQIWRESAHAFAGDERALTVCRGAVAKGWIEAELELARRRFWLMPLMHSEDLSTQEAGLSLFERFTDPRTFDFARRHRDVIARFGRFPHRNEALGRPSTPAETAFLKQPGSRF